MKKISVTLATAAISMLGMSVDATNPRGVDRANLNESIRPGQDFYDYATGGWQKANPLKPEFSRFGTFDQLGELNRKQVYDLVMGLDAKNAVPGTNEQKIADLFAMGMDSVRLNKEGNKAIQQDLKLLKKAKKADIPVLMATLPGLSVFFGTGVEADMMNSDINAMYWGQGGLGLGDRDYYIVDGENEKKVLDAYKLYLKRLAELAGFNSKDADRMVKNAIEIETRLAKAAMSREELRNPIASYNPMLLTEIEAKYPNVGLASYFDALKVPSTVETVIVAQPKSLAEVNEIIKDTDLQALRDYMVTSYLQSAAPYLSDDFIKANFELAQVKSGVQQMQPRWKRALAIPNGMLGEALGELYVAKYFPPESKAKMLELVNNLKSALGDHIDSLTWMSDITKAKAHEKLNTFTVKIGYPDKWQDYSALTIDPSKTYWENVKAAIQYATDYNTNDFGKPVDKDRWYMSPQTVNAYYSPLTNEICFPAGILQAPYFDPNASDAENYGAIGVVIGHEMTHGFDDQGRQYDKDGNLKNWWTEEDAEAFKKLADGLTAQFNDVVVLGDTHANGAFTLGENIADQGGLRVAHTAFHKAVGDKNELVNGFTPDQAFYLAYANVWAGNIRDAEILNRTKNDPHSLGRWRVNATLRNIGPFFEAFNIKEGDPMFRPVEERVIIW